ncbi:transcriptional activator hap3 [Coniothyrium glycines]
MSATPPKKEGVEPAQSPDEDQPMDRNAEDTQAQGLGYEFEVKEQDRWLPIANVARIMKMALPENAKIAKEAKECMQECVSEFISFITSEASEKCQQEKRKTVNGEDILFAMTSLGFENYSEALKIYLSRYRETLLANQNKPPTGQFAAGPGGPNPGAENQQHVLSGDSEMAENEGTTFGYQVHNGNGSGGDY